MYCFNASDGLYAVSVSFSVFNKILDKFQHPIDDLLSHIALLLRVLGFSGSEYTTTDLLQHEGFELDSYRLGIACPRVVLELLNRVRGGRRRELQMSSNSTTDTMWNDVKYSPYLENRAGFYENLHGIRNGFGQKATPLKSANFFACFHLSLATFSNQYF